VWRVSARESSTVHGVFDSPSKAELARKIDDLMALATAPDVPDRLARLRKLVSEEVQFINPGVMAVGVQELTQVFGRLSRSLPGDTEIRRASTIDFHHDHFRYAWVRRRAGHIEAEGVDLGQAGSDGRIVKIVTFDGLVPTPRGQNE
jgi:hypothetical protein